MSKPRPYRKYEFKVGNTIKHKGITTDLKRREGEHQGKWPNGHIKPVGGPVTEKSARDWEEDQGVS